MNEYSKTLLEQLPAVDLDVTLKVTDALLVNDIFPLLPSFKKTVEESFKGSGLVRCNRKYIVNIKKVSMLRKESDGYVLDLANETIPPLPITKTYTDAILSYFTDESPLLEPMDE